jgi:hypothetical protein
MSSVVKNGDSKTPHDMGAFDVFDHTHTRVTRALRPAYDLNYKREWCCHLRIANRTSILECPNTKQISMFFLTALFSS